ncbi:lycopene cyclase family protein [Tsukamurella sp. 1534]|uniref:lycopene cyclase family protein n=1 Tax=Tsukamurella sp. 1534 TaxID=1151061 RepID=UPI0002FB68F7|nr:lycopene cyclase family protein [Tsukamurella sp. 1534]
MSGPDLVVLGLGPAGRATAHRAASAGMTVLAFDPAPDRRWRRTFGLWADELPGWLPPGVVAARSFPEVVAGARFRLGREYAVLDVDRLQDALTLGGVEVRSAAADRDAALRDHPGAFVVDARGPAPSADPRVPRQTAAGVLVAAGAHDELWMDWRPAPGVGEDEAASFLYAVRVTADSVLLEETCLAGAPALTVDELESRLRRRLAVRGVSAGEVYERVDFPLLTDGPRRGHRWCGVGVRGTSLHPATGYSVAASLAFADDASAAFAAGRGPVTASGVAAHRLRSAALRALLGMSAREQRAFFEVFFGLPDRHVRAFLSARSGPAATAAAMTAAFAAAPWDLRRRLSGAISPATRPRPRR